MRFLRIFFAWIIAFLVSCIYEKPQVKNIINATAEVDALSPAYEFRIDVRLQSKKSSQQKEPITDALVVVNLDTLAEVEPGHYQIKYWEFYIIPETLNFQIISEEDTILYLLPMPYNVVITFPESFDTVGAGEDLNIIWRKNSNANFYEVQIFPCVTSSPDSNAVIFDTLLLDTSVIVPRDIIEQGSFLILVKAVSGPELINGEIEPNYHSDNWEGTFMGSAGNYVIVTSISSKRRYLCLLDGS